MSNLTPEKRVDKNGVLTTKHVRAGLKSKVALKGVPAPTVAKAAPVGAGTVQKRWRVNVKHWDSDHELEVICRDRFAPAQTYECSEAEAYGLMAAVSPENVLPLLAIGIRSEADARSFLKKVRLDRLISENREIADEAILRGFSARDFIRFASENKLSLNQKTFMDAAEVDANPKMKKVDLLRKDFTVLPSISTMVLIGWIRASDLKELGEDIVVRHGARFEASRRTRDLIWNQLHLLKQNKLAYKSVSTMRQIILDNQDTGTRQIKDSLICAGLYGLDSVTDVAPGYIHEGQRLDDVVIDRSIPERKKVYDYAVNLRKSGVPRNVDPEEMIQFSDAGLPLNVVIDGVNEGMTAPQIIALHQGEVAPSISKGWL
jgi:hypothetical protein